MLGVQRLSGRIANATAHGAASQGRNVAAKADARRQPRPENSPANSQFFVDHTCIDCDTCRWMASHTFDRVNGMSAVVEEPQTRAQRIEAIQATLSCPTFSIHMRHNDSSELKEAQAGMPIPVPDCPGVYHCGFHDEKSFGATSYVIVRNGGEANIMMDCPRFNPKLAKNIEALGGLKYIVLSHIDDISDHDKWAKHFGCARVMHETEIRPHIRDIETQIRGAGPWNLQGEAIGEDELDGDVQLVHTPGHTAGSISMWHAPTKTMFTGDHFGFSYSKERASIFPRYNRHGRELQVRNVEKLLKYDFLHILPGHGRRFYVKDANERQQAFEDVKADAGMAVA